MKHLTLFFSLALAFGLLACASTSQPEIPGDGATFAGIGLQFET